MEITIPRKTAPAKPANGVKSPTIRHAPTPMVSHMTTSSTTASLVLGVAAGVMVAGFAYYWAPKGRRWLFFALMLGVIAKLALFFATHALFERQIAFGPVELPDLTSARLWMVALSAAAAVALIRYKTNLLLVLAVCALAARPC